MQHCKEKGTLSSETVQVSITGSSVNKRGISFVSFAKAICIKTSRPLGSKRKRKNKSAGNRVDELMMPVISKKNTSTDNSIWKIIMITSISYFHFL